jgi:hypothetical protein
MKQGKYLKFISKNYNKFPKRIGVSLHQNFIKIVSNYPKNDNFDP